MSKKLTFSANLYLNLNSLIQIRNLSQHTQKRYWFDRLQSLFGGIKISRIKLLLCIKELNELFVCLSAIFPSENKTMDLKLIYKYIYKPIFENVAIWKNILNSLCIYFLFSSQSVSFFLCYIYIYIQFWKVFKNRYLHIFIEPKETQSCKRGLKQVRICLDEQVSS